MSKCSQCPQCGGDWIDWVNVGIDPGTGKQVAVHWVSTPHETGGIRCLRRQLAQAVEREAALQKLISAQDEQLLLVGRWRDTEKARADKALEELKDSRTMHAQLCKDIRDKMPKVVLESKAWGGGAIYNMVQHLRTIYEVERKRADKAEADLANVDSFLDRRDAIDDLPDRYAKIQKVLDFAKRTEKAEADNAGYKSHLDNALRQAKKVCPDYPWSASPTMSEIAWAVCSTLEGTDLACGDWEAVARRLLGAALPVAKQLDEPMVEGADGSRCRLVPVGLLLTLREALAAKPKVPSAAERGASVEKRCGTCDFWTPGHLKTMGECGVEMEGTTIDRICPFNMWKPKQAAKEDDSDA